MVVNANSIVQHVNQIKKEIIKHVKMNVKIMADAKKIIVGIPADVFVRTVWIFKKYFWYFSDYMWWNYICYGYCIHKNKQNVAFIMKSKKVLMH